MFYNTEQERKLDVARFILCLLNSASGVRSWNQLSGSVSENLQQAVG
jgi:hypothetical protein